MQTVLETGETVCQDNNLLVDTSSLDITYTIFDTSTSTVLCKSNGNESHWISSIVRMKFHRTLVRKLVGRFSLAPCVISPKQRAMFLRIFISERKFAMKSLGKTKQFSARHVRSSCHVMSTKQDIKISRHRRFQTLVWTMLIVFWLYLRCV